MSSHFLCINKMIMTTGEVLCSLDNFDCDPFAKESFRFWTTLIHLKHLTEKFYNLNKY